MRKTLIPVVVALLLSVSSPVLAGDNGRIPVSAQEVSAAIVDPGTWWFTGPPWEHYRGHAREMVATERDEGSEYFQGEQTSVANWDAVFARCDEYGYTCGTVRGQFWGTFEIELDAFDGGWSGEMTGRIVGLEPTTGLMVEGKAVAQGWGDLEGWQLRLDWSSTSEAPGFKVFSGYAIPPKT